LFEIVHALDAQCASFGFRQRRQQHGRQDGDDRDNDEQFNQSERPYFTEFLHMTWFCFVFGKQSANSRESAFTVNPFPENLLALVMPSRFRA
jgi:hypothetical protein